MGLADMPFLRLVLQQKQVFASKNIGDLNVAAIALSDTPNTLTIKRRG